jgi:hypothetical protein
VIFSPYVEEQAVDRVHRIGQVKEVKVIKITMEDSIEERIEELKEKKMYVLWYNIVLIFYCKFRSLAYDYLRDAVDVYDVQEGRFLYIISCILWCFLRKDIKNIKKTVDVNEMKLLISGSKGRYVIA